MTTTLTLATACIAAILCLSAAEAAERTRPVPRGMTESEYEKIIGWRHGLTPAESRLVDAHLKEHGPIRARPVMTNSVLGVRYRPTEGLPFAVFAHVVAGSPETPSMAMLDAFNIQLISPDHTIDPPRKTVLRSTLTMGGKRAMVHTEMVLRDGAYYVANPVEYLSEFRLVVEDVKYELGRTPKGRTTLEHDELSGFTFNAETVRDMPPLGAPVVYNIRYGDVRVHTGFQWVGRPLSIPFNDGTEFLR